MKQYSCSELLTDFHIRDVDEVYNFLKVITEKYNWNWGTPLTKENLRKLKEENEEDYSRGSMVVYDSEGHDAELCYGHNGYEDLGFRFEAEQHYSSRNFPFLDKALEDLEQATLNAYDGGSTRNFEEWKNGL